MVLTDKRRQLVRELYAEGMSERKIASQLRTTRRQVITSLKATKKSSESVLEHTVNNLFLKFKPISKIKKQTGASPKKIKEITAKLPSEKKEIVKRHSKPFYKRMEEDVKHFQNKNFPYYVYGKFSTEKAKQAEYPIDKKQYYHKGIKSFEDMLDFYKIKPLLASYRIYNENGDKISLDALRNHFNVSRQYMDKMIKEMSE